MKKILFAILFGYLFSTYGMEELIIYKKSKSETTAASVVTQRFAPKSFKNICFEKLTQTIKQSVDPKEPFKNLLEVKKIINAVPDLGEELLNYLHENTQPVWKKSARLLTNDFEFSEAAFASFNKTTIAWRDNNFLRYLDTTRPSTSHIHELPDGYEVPEYPLVIDYLRKNPNPLRITADQRYMVTAPSSGSELFLFDTQTLHETRLVAPDRISAFACSSDGIASLGAANGSCYFVKKNGNDLHEISGETPFFSNPVCALEFSADGSILVASDDLTVVSSYKAEDFKKVHTLTIPELSNLTEQYIIKSLHLSPDASLLIINFGYMKNLAFSFAYNRSIELPYQIIKIDRANRCIGATWTHQEGDEEDPEAARYCQLDYVSLDFANNSYGVSTYVLPKDTCCSVKYQSNTAVNPLSVVFRQKDNQYPNLLIQKKVNLKKLLYLIAVQKASCDELYDLFNYPLLKSFKEKCCGNVVKQYINYRLEHDRP